MPPVTACLAIPDALALYPHRSNLGKPYHKQAGPFLTKPFQPRALIVAHGQPSDPAPAEAELALLAAKVAALLPNWQFMSATLADPNSLARAVTGTHGLVYPMFMSGGWFTATHLPERLAAVGGKEWRILTPFGLDPRVQTLAVSIAQEATQGQTAPEVLLAAHGSFRSPAPADVAYSIVDQLVAAGILHAKAGFIDQYPRIADVAGGFGPHAVCLPFFAAKGGHVIDDLPEALAKANFSGRLLPPLGLNPRVPALIADALQTALYQSAVTG
jgi:sirohydrochlorin ferrochelatase